MTKLVEAYGQAAFSGEAIMCLNITNEVGSRATAET